MAFVTIDEIETDFALQEGTFEGKRTKERTNPPILRQ